MESLYLETNPFTIFNGEHWIWLMYGVLSTIFWIRLGRKAPTQVQKQRVALWMGLLGVVAWVYSDLVMFATGQAKSQSVIPFHLCYVLNLALPYIFWKGRIELFDWIYPIVIAGCLQALFTPDLSQGFPHYYNIRYWFVHVALVQYAFFAIFVFDFRPTFMGIFKCILAINLYALCLVPINWLLDTNFLYIRYPAKGSIMEMLGPWPQYLFALEGLMFVFFLIVYLPFGLTPKKQHAQQTIQP